MHVRKTAKGSATWIDGCFDPGFKDGDQSRLQALSGLDTRVVEEDGEEDEADEEDYEEEDEVHYSHFIYNCLLIISKSASWRLHR